jgi:hypothetical protein
MNENYPLIIVFYLDAEMMKVKEIIQPFTESVNTMLNQKKANAMAFFLPTNGEERVECINPLIVPKDDMEKVATLIEDIKKSFDIGAEITVEHEEIELDEKPCDCGNNLDGKCKCNE